MAIVEKYINKEMVLNAFDIDLHRFAILSFDVHFVMLETFPIDAS